MLNPDAVTLQLLLDPLAFDGRTYSSEQTEVINTSGANTLIDVPVHIISRNNVLAAAPPTSIVQLTQTRENATGLRQVPVVLAEFAAGGIAFAVQNLISENVLTLIGQPARHFFVPPFVLGPDEALLVTVVPALAVTLFMNTHGTYNPLPR